MTEFKIAGLENFKNSKIYPVLIKIGEKSKYTAFPLILAIICANAAQYVFTLEIINKDAVLSFVGIILLYILFIAVSNKRIIGKIIHIAVFFIIPNLGVYILRTGSGVYPFIVWFFSGGQLLETEPEFLTALSLFSIYLFAFSLYYFTFRIYRKLMVFIIAIIPFVIFVKAAIAIPTAFIFISVGLQIFIFIQNQRILLRKRSSVGGKKSLLAVYGDYALALVLLIYILPKPAVTPFAEQVEEFLNANFTFGNFGDNALEGYFSDESGNADNFNRSQERLLYTVITDKPNYLKIQTFNTYNPERNRWYTEYGSEVDYPIYFDEEHNRYRIDSPYSVSYNWEEEQRGRNYSDLSKGILAAAAISAEFAENYGLTAQTRDFGILSDIAAEDEPSFTINVHSEDFPAPYFALPERTFRIDQISETVRAYGGGITGEYFIGADSRYSGKYYSEDFFSESGYKNTAIAALSNNDFINMLYTARNILQDSGDNISADILQSFIDDAQDVRYLRVWAENHYETPEITALAEEITAGLNTDYDKASALASYFTEAGFEYVLGYLPASGFRTVQDFMFVSKMGTCSDFATAFCLMAQSLGLSVRYCEGFVPQLISPLDGGDGLTYSVTTYNAHAYPEVFLNGGWVRFEPTVGSLSSFGTAVAAQQAADQMTQNIILIAEVIAVTFIGILTVLFLIFRSKLAEKWFRITVGFYKSETAIIMLYKRFGKNLEKLCDKRGITINSIFCAPQEISDLAKKQTGTGIDILAKAVNDSVYGGIKPTKEDFKVCFNNYKIFFKYRKQHRSQKLEDRSQIM
ncbi:MAG: transglutaminase-like domain-containing protein [Ruminococcus sp.]|jgi:transglutaminase-like putative cysteine protease|nr:transglutaminase-like domain-containing protein [Ruminococcus sp.]